MEATPQIEKRILRAPFTDDVIRSLTAGDLVYLSGTIYTARDAAHKRLYEMLDRGEPMPFDFTGQVVYYAGPCPAKPGQPIGSVGPTTAGRMDAYSPRLIREGLKVMTVTELPVIVAIDCQGRNVYETGRAAYEQD